MIEDAYLAAKTFGNSLLLLDRYFLSVPALIRLNELNQNGSVQMEIVTKAKRSCKAFEGPEPKKPGTKVRPAKKGDPVHLMKLFDTNSNEFLQTEATFCSGGISGNKKYPCQHQLETGSAGSDLPLQLSFPDRMHLQRIKTADGCILLPFLVKVLYCNGDCTDLVCTSARNSEFQ